MADLASRSAEFLSRTSLFGELPPEVINGLAREFRWGEVDAGHVFIDSSRKQPHGVFILADGKAEVFRPDAKGAVRPLAILEAIDCFGEFAAIHGAPGSASVRSATKCAVGEVPSSVFLALVVDRPNLSIELLRRLVGKIRDLDDEVGSSREREAILTEISRKLFLSTL